jgi:O-antigen ligase
MRGNRRDQSLSTAALNLRPGFSLATLYSAPAIGYVPKTVQYSFLLFVFSIPFEDLKVPYLTEGTLSIAKLFGLSFFAFYLFHLVIQVLFFKKSVPEVPIPMRWFIAYFVVYALGGWLLDHELGRAYLLRLFTLAQILGFFWCATDLLKDQSLAKRGLLVFAAACVILAVGTLLDLPGFVPEVDRRTRALGMNPNNAAPLMVYAAVILIAFCLNESCSRKRKALLLSLTLPLFALLVSTASRSGIGAFVIGITMFFFMRGGLKRKVIAALSVFAGIAVLLGFVLSNEVAMDRWARFFLEGNTSGRGELYAAALGMIGESPIAGWGRNTGFEELGLRIGLGGRIDAHNFLLYLLIEVGLVGTVPFLIGLGLCLWAAWKARVGPLNILPVTLLVTSVASMLTHTALAVKPLWLFLALALAGAAAAKRRQVMVRATTASDGSFRVANRQRIADHDAARLQRP